MVKDSEFNQAWVEQHIVALLDDEQRLEQLGAKAWSHGMRDAAQALAARVLDMAR